MKKRFVIFGVIGIVLMLGACKPEPDPEPEQETEQEQNQEEQKQEEKKEENKQEENKNYDPNDIKAFIITYETEMGETPKQIALAEGAFIKKEHLPALSVETGYYNFTGWYLGTQKMEADTYKIASDITLTADWAFDHYDYTTTDTSDYLISAEGNSSFSLDGEYTKVTPKKTSIANWVMSRKENGINYQLSNVYGFELSVKCDTEIDWAGMEWLNTKGYNCYYFEVHGDGSFRVRFHNADTSQWTTVIEVAADSSNVRQNDYNTLKVAPTKDSDFEIFINDKKVGTITRGSLSITPGPIAFAATGKNGSAWLKFLSYTQLK